jgi:hypothetical protein
VGLDCFLRRIPKSVIHNAIGRTDPDPLEGIEYHGGVEMGYWRGWRSLNRHIISAAMARIPPEAEPLFFNGKAILLSQENILEIKLEVLWGDLWRDREEKILPYEAWSHGQGILSKRKERILSEQKNRDIGIFDRALRVLKNNRSYVYYLGSW